MYIALIAFALCTTVNVVFAQPNVPPGACPPGQQPESVKAQGAAVALKCGAMITPTGKTVETITRTTNSVPKSAPPALNEKVHCGPGEFLSGFVSTGDSFQAYCSTPINAQIIMVNEQPYVYTLAESFEYVTRQNQVIHKIWIEEREGQQVVILTLAEVMIEDWSPEGNEVDVNAACMCLCIGLCDRDPVGDIQPETTTASDDGGSPARRRRDAIYSKMNWFEHLRAKRQARRIKGGSKQSSVSEEKTGTGEESGSKGKSGSKEKSEKSAKKKRVKYVLTVDEESDPEITKYVIEPAQNIRLCPADECDCGCMCS